MVESWYDKVMNNSSFGRVFSWNFSSEKKTHRKCFSLFFLICKFLTSFFVFHTPKLFNFQSLHSLFSLGVKTEMQLKEKLSEV